MSGHNVNVTNTVNKISKRNPINITNNVNEGKYVNSKRIEGQLAPKLARMLGTDKSSMEFLYKCFWKLSEARVWHNAEQAIKGRNPMALFIYLCKRDGV